MITDLNEKVLKLESAERETRTEFEKNHDSWQNERNEFEIGIDKLKMDVENVSAELAACVVNLEEFSRLRETLLKSDDTIKVWGSKNH